MFLEHFCISIGYIYQASRLGMTGSDHSNPLYPITSAPQSRRPSHRDRLLRHLCPRRADTFNPAISAAHQSTAARHLGRRGQGSGGESGCPGVIDGLASSTSDPSDNAVTSVRQFIQNHCNCTQMSLSCVINSLCVMHWCLFNVCLLACCTCITKFTASATVYLLRSYYKSRYVSLSFCL